jgi:hypothetical protein
MVTVARLPFTRSSVTALVISKEETHAVPPVAGLLSRVSCEIQTDNAA